MSDLMFKLGDVVKHKSAEIKMVIITLPTQPDGQYGCSWFDKTISGASDKGFVTSWHKDFELSIFEQ